MMINFRKTPCVYILGCTSGMLLLLIIRLPQQSNDLHSNDSKQETGTDDAKDETGTVRRAQNCPAPTF